MSTSIATNNPIGIVYYFLTGPREPVVVRGVNDPRNPLRQQRHTHRDSAQPQRASLRLGERKVYRSAEEADRYGVEALVWRLHDRFADRYPLQLFHDD